MYERWLRLAAPLHSKHLKRRLLLLKLTRVRMRVAQRVRDAHLRTWLRSRVEVYAEIKRLEAIGLQEEQQRRLAEIER